MAGLVFDSFATTQIPSTETVAVSLVDFTNSASRTITGYDVPDVALVPVSSGVVQVGVAPSSGELSATLATNQAFDVTWHSFSSPSFLSPDVLSGPNPFFILEGVKWDNGGSVDPIGNPDPVARLTIDVFTGGPTAALSGFVDVPSTGAFDPFSDYTVSLIGGPISSDSVTSVRLRFRDPVSGTGGTAGDEAELTIRGLSFGVVPEPSSFLLAGIGLAVVGGVRYRRRKLAVLNS